MQASWSQAKNSHDLNNSVIQTMNPWWNNTHKEFTAALPIYHLPLGLTCGRRHVTPPCSLAMGVELSENREVSSEGKSGSSNRASSPPHSALPSSFMAPAALQPGIAPAGSVGEPQPAVTILTASTDISLLCYTLKQNKWLYTFMRFLWFCAKIIGTNRKLHLAADVCRKVKV